MRFGAPDSDDDAQVASTSQNHPWRSPAPQSGTSRISYATTRSRTALGKRPISYAAPSDSESDVDRAEDSDEDDENLGLSSSWEQVKKGKTPAGKEEWRKVATNLMGSKKGEERFSAMMEIIENEPNEYEAWVKITEEAAWRQGHKLAHSRRRELREIALNAKAEKRSEQDLQAEQELEDMQKMLKGLAIARTQAEEEARRVFKEREKKLWADIDAAIKRTEQLELEKRQLEAERRKKIAEEELARKTASEQAAAAVLAEQQRKAKEDAARIHAEGMARYHAEQVAKDMAQKLKDEQAAKQKVADQRGLMGAQWKAWVEKQKTIKSEIIEKVKADKGIKTDLRPGMRLINRGLGQVVNTRDSIVRVTNDIAAIINQQLPTPATAASPVLLSSSPPIAYSYLLSQFAKTLIKQAESEVSAKQDAAFPLGRIVLGLLMRGHAALGEILFARLIKKCPWIVPFYPSKRQDQPRAEYEKSTGRSTDESMSDYVNRMAGITTLYFAILQTSYTSMIPTLPAAPTPDQLLVLIIPPLRSTAAWTWLSYALRDPMPSLPPIAHLLANWIDVCGHEIGRVYGREQLGKVYDAIKKEGLGENKVKGDGETSKQKLGLLLENGNQPGEPHGRNWQL